MSRDSLLDPARADGAVRADAELRDLLRLVDGVGPAAGSPEGAGRLLAPAWRGVARA